jgi:hypothetical protein
VYKSNLSRHRLFWFLHHERIQATTDITSQQRGRTGRSSGLPTGEVSAGALTDPPGPSTAPVSPRAYLRCSSCVLAVAGIRFQRARSDPPVGERRRSDAWTRLPVFAMRVPSCSRVFRTLCATYSDALGHPGPPLRATAWACACVGRDGRAAVLTVQQDHLCGRWARRWTIRRAEVNSQQPASPSSMPAYRCYSASRFWSWQS